MQIILILNAGSSSIKFALYDCSNSLQLLLKGQVENLTQQPHLIIKDAKQKLLLDNYFMLQDQVDAHQQALAIILAWVKQQLQGAILFAVGHRIVHGGTYFSQAVIINETVIEKLTQLIPLAPLHQPHNLAGIAAIKALQPAVVQIACFDTAFHQTQPDIAQTFALPENLSPLPIKRYGFHGLSYDYITDVLPEFLNEKIINGKIIIAHLGHGASLCAIKNRTSIATTMGFTALDGLIMGTRCGNLDPGVILYLLQQQNYSAEQIANILYYQSGLLGVSGISADMRVLENSAEPRAKFALDLYVYRLVREIGSLTAALGGLDALIFTAGIGENSSYIRAAVCEQLTWLGVVIDSAANQRQATCINKSNSHVQVRIIPANEELIIAQQVEKLLN